MTDSGAKPGDFASEEQNEQARELAAEVGEEVPSGMRAAEAAQRIEELKVQQEGESG
jgi:hypothetical protein